MTTAEGVSDDISFITREPVSEEPNDLGDFVNTHLSAAWRFNVKAGTVVASGVLIANISILAWANARFGLKDGSSTVFEGSCSEMKRITLWADLTINVLSTLLLGASNNCAQLLTAPTRKNIDLAHIKGKWLDIGVPSTRNISIIGRWRFFLLSVLFGSSIPLHLLYNSVFYSTTSANNYMAAIVTEDFVEGGYWNKTRAANLLEGLGLTNEGAVSSNEGLSSITSLQDRASDLERLGNAECIQAYGTSTLVSNWLNVLVVTNSTQRDGLLTFDYHDSTSSYDEDWICNRQDSSSSCDTESMTSNADNWTINTYYVLDTVIDYFYPGNAIGNYTTSATVFTTGPAAGVRYCLAEKFMPHCSVSVSTPLLSIVIVCNVLKVCCMVSTLFIHNFTPLATIGDAIASFMRYPDRMTEGKGPLSAVDVRSGDWLEADMRKPRRNFKRPSWAQFPAGWRGAFKQLSRTSLHLGTSATWELLSLRSQSNHYSQVWQGKTYHWFRSASLGRWATCILLCATVWFTGLGLLVDSGNASLSEMWKDGVGSINTDNVIIVSNTTSVIAMVLLANTPQLIVSFLYLMYNNIFTCMLLGLEYNQLATHRKALRVSKARGKQRSAYFLQLPYRYSIPMMFAMGTLHWLIARSIFLVEIVSYDIDGSLLPQDYTINRCGYSGMAILLALVVGGLMILALILHGCRKLNPGMPIASSCSAAISAACHPPSGEPEDAAFLPLQYGVVDKDRVGELSDEAEHACFSSQNVVPLLKGVTYI